jgi:hypothetical protein
MKTIRSWIRFLGASLVFLASLAYSHQEKYVTGRQALPDSLRQQLTARIDEVRIRRNWGKLRRGLAPEAVEALFGKPARISSSMYDNSDTWRYGKHCIIFDSIKNTVRSWEVKK